MPAAISFCSVNFFAVLLSAALLVISAAIVVSVTSVFSANAADDYARQLTQAVVDGGRTRVTDYISIARNVILSTHFAWTAGSYPNFLHNQSRGLPQDAFMRALSPIIYATNFRITAVGAGFNDGTFTYCGVMRSQTQKFFCEFSDPMLPTWQPLPNGTFAWHFTETYHDYENGTRAPAPRLTHTLFDPRPRLWYAPHIASGPYGDMRFTPVYTHFFQDYPIVSLSIPMANTSDNTLMGVVYAAVDLRDLSTFLSELPATPGSAAVIVDNDGMLLGISDKGSLFDIFGPSAPYDARLYVRCVVNSGTGNRVCRRGPAGSSMPTIRQLHAARPDLLGPGAGVGAPRTARIEVVTMGGKDYYVGTSAASNFTNLPWRLVTVIPEDDLTGEITKGRNLAIILAAVVAVAASVVSAVALWLLLRPLRALAERMLVAATLRDGAGGEAVGSRMAEIRTIEDAFNTLFGQLMKARSFLPASLLAQLDAQGEVGEEDEDTVCEPSPDHRGSHVSSRVSSEGRSDGARSIRSVRRSSANAGDTSAHEGTKTDTSSDVTIFGIAGDASPSAAGGLQPSSVLRTKNVTVLCFNLVGFHAQVRADAAGALGGGYAALVEAASELTRARRGVLDSFHGDRFVVTFNAAIGCGAHATAALHVASAMVAAAGGRRSTAGVACGIAHVGNTGSSKARRFATVGPVYTQASVLERLAKTVSAPLTLMTRAVADDAQHAARSVFVELVQLPGASAAAGNPAPIASLVSMQTQAKDSDEWMYELAANEGSSDASAVARVNTVFLELAASLLFDPSGRCHTNDVSSSNHALILRSQITSTNAQALAARLAECKNFLRDKNDGRRKDFERALSTCDRLLEVVVLRERMQEHRTYATVPAAVCFNVHAKPAVTASPLLLRSEAVQNPDPKITPDLGVFYVECMC